MHKKSERDVILEGLKSGENIRKSKTLQRPGVSIGNCGSWWSRGKPWWPRQKSHASEKPLSQHSSQALTAKCVWECELKREWRMGKSPATNVGTKASKPHPREHRNINIQISSKAYKLCRSCLFPKLSTVSAGTDRFQSDWRLESLTLTTFTRSDLELDAFLQH